MGKAMAHKLQPFKMPGPTYHKSQISIQTRYIILGTVLESVPTAKYLGITISDDISWSPHTDSISKKLTKH